MAVMDQTTAAADIAADYRALTEGAAFIDFSNRGRLCLLGDDRQTFINGQVTNNVRDLQVGQGRYAALANAKGKMTSDLNIFILKDEILLDFEPGIADAVKERLEKFIIADDVEIVDASSYHLLSVMGPHAAEACKQMERPAPTSPYEITEDLCSYFAATPRLGTLGIDIFVPGGWLQRIMNSLENAGVKRASFESFDTVRIEQGIPRFGVDMDENTLAPEALGENAISYSKGCYIGQEVIARIRTYGQVAKALRGLRFDAAASVPKPGDKIFHDGKEVGWITSAVFSPKLERPIALGYVRKECNAIGARLVVNDAGAEIVTLPFQR
jgi:folate-binding protein YgfZ